MPRLPRICPCSTRRARPRSGRTRCVACGSGADRPAGGTRMSAGAPARGPDARRAPGPCGERGPGPGGERGPGPGGERGPGLGGGVRGRCSGFADRRQGTGPRGRCGAAVRPVVAVAGGRAFTFRYAETTELLTAAGLEPGDTILSIDGVAVDSFDEASAIVRAHPGDRINRSRADCRCHRGWPTFAIGGYQGGGGNEAGGRC